MLKQKLLITIRTTLLSFLALVTVINFDIASAAEPIKPPFEGSLKERYAIVITNDTQESDQNYSFNIEKTLWDPRKQANQNDDVTISNFSHYYSDILSHNKRQVDCHIMVISRFRKHPMFRDEIVDNPDGMSIQQLPAVGPGVFDCSDELIRIYLHVIDENQDNKAPPVTDLLAMVESSDIQSRRLAVFQLAMHRDWMQHATQDNVDKLQRIFTKNSLTHEAAEMLIQASKGLSEQQQNGWFRDYLLNVLKTNPSPYDLASYTPLLVRSSLLTLKELSLVQELDWDIIMPFIYSNAPGVSKATIQTLSHLNSEKFNTEVKTLLSDQEKSTQLHLETRRALAAYLQRASSL